MNATERRRLTKARLRRGRPPIVVSLEYLDAHHVELKPVRPGSVTFVPYKEFMLRARRPPRYLQRSVDLNHGQGSGIRHGGNLLGSDRVGDRRS